MELSNLEEYLFDLRFKESYFTINSHNTLSIVGKDASSFLENQVTTEVSSLEDNSFHESAIVDIKGRVVSSFILVKESSSAFYIIFDKDYEKALLERLNLYLVSEDVEFEKIETDLFFILNPKNKNFKGSLFGLEASLCFSIDKDIIEADSEKLSLLRFISGKCLMGTHVNSGELITNSYLTEYAIDFDKGCFPGQETIRKIYNNRGASFFPMLLIGKNEIKENIIRLDGKKIGELKEVKPFDGEFFHYVNLSRTERINGKKLVIGDGSFVVQDFPLVDNSKKKRAMEAFDKAVLEFHKDKNEKAKELLLIAIELEPEFSDAYESLGVILGREKNFSEAIEVMKQLSEVDPRSVMAHTNLSMYYMQLGDKETAEDHKAKATLKQFEKFGHEADLKRKEEELLEQKKIEKEQRLNMFIQVLEIDPEDALANLGLGELKLEQKKYDQAIGHLEIALKSDPNYSVAYLSLAKALIANSDIEHGKEILEKGILIASKNGDLMPANEMQGILNNIK